MFENFNKNKKICQAPVVVHNILDICQRRQKHMINPPACDTETLFLTQESKDQLKQEACLRKQKTITATIYFGSFFKWFDSDREHGKYICFYVFACLFHCPDFNV